MGAEALRNRASEMAEENTRALVENFGQMGRRRFALAS